MQSYPHLYQATAAGSVTGTVAVGSPSLPQIATAPPPEFGGPGRLWSPETLLCAAVANCFILTFRAVSRTAGFGWSTLDCRVEGTLERAEGQARFTRFATFAKLGVPPGADVAKARALLEQAERVCLVANSLCGARTLQAEVAVAAAN
jgi:organic hydroperoxide reductase OsmC/OhrA